MTYSRREILRLASGLAAGTVTTRGARPIAAIERPVRVPAGVHGSWIDGRMI